MPVINRIADFHDDMTAWRRELHSHPEIGFEEVWTSDFIVARLAEFGIKVDRGMAKTGVVGTLRNGDGPAIALRADMDALPLDEANDFAHRSQNPGRMHACGHDGHSTMLLGAARYLAETKRFKGTVHFVFQPAEESFAGGRKMVEDGLFKKFPVKGVYGMHNWPGLPFGQFGVISGPIMASADQFEITVKGQGVHAAMPHRGVDCVVVASQIVMALQTIASRTVDPIDSAVVSVGRFAAGDTFNILPDAAHLSGTVRTFSNAVRDAVEDTFRRIVDGVCAAHGTSAEIDYQRDYPPTVNHAAETEIAAAAAAGVAGEANVRRDIRPAMVSEDFSFMMEAVPGCYVWVGAGEQCAALHNPAFDFNDELLPVGASYWATLVERELA